MRDRLVIALLKSLGRLPLRFNQRLGRALGDLAWLLRVRERYIAQTNLALCFPERDAAWRDRMARESLREMGAAMLEAPRLWTLGREGILQCLENPEALSELQALFGRGHGLIVSAPHLGAWEYVGLIVATAVPMTSLFRPSRMPAVDDFVRAGRISAGANLVPTDTRGIRALAKALAQHECVGILPDQEPPLGNGVYAEFFGVPAYTMILLPRLAGRHATQVAHVVAERRPNGRFRLHYRLASPELGDPDPVRACSALNRDLEAMIRILPEQYNWIYKRFREQPDGRDLYRASEA